jgi:hypothetical protein
LGKENHAVHGEGMGITLTKMEIGITKIMVRIKKNAGQTEGMRIIYTKVSEQKSQTNGRE